VNYYVFDVLLRPRQAGVFDSKFAGARANIWVRAGTLDEARVLAVADLTEFFPIAPPDPARKFAAVGDRRYSFKFQ